MIPCRIWTRGFIKVRILPGIFNRIYLRNRKIKEERPIDFLRRHLAARGATLLEEARALVPTFEQRAAAPVNRMDLLRKVQRSFKNGRPGAAMAAVTQLNRLEQLDPLQAGQGEDAKFTPEWMREATQSLFPQATESDILDDIARVEDTYLSPGRKIEATQYVFHISTLMSRYESEIIISSNRALEKIPRFRIGFESCREFKAG